MKYAQKDVLVKRDEERRKPSYISTEFIVAIVLIGAAMLVTLLMQHVYMRRAAIVLIFAAAVIYFLVSSWAQQRMVFIAAQLLEKSAEKMDKYVHAVSIPTAITTPNGRIVWHNPAFFMLAGMQCEGKNIFRIFPQVEKPERDKKVKIGGDVYFKEAIRTQLAEREYVIYRFVDAENSCAADDLCRVVMATVCHMQIDNYDDLLRSAPQGADTQIRTEIERIVAKSAQNMHAIYQRYDRDKYIIVFERRHLSGLMQSKFPMLEEVRRIDVGAPGLHPTLSVGVGVSAGPDDANRNALKALEMALGRGGDQAVLKDETGYKFYGGIQQGREKRTRVKARMFANALRNLMEQCERVIVMGHTVPDLDCMGAALGLTACASRLGKKAYIVMDKSNVAIAALVDEMKRDPDDRNMLISPVEAMGLMDTKTMLIVVDTQIAAFTVAPQLFERAVTTVVIDHHVRGTEHIENATLFLHEPYASSAAEMVTEIVQYFAENVVLKPLAVEALLAGISIDTKGFSFKTGERTFEAASYLRRLGADTTKIRHLFQDDLETFTLRARVVQDAEVLPGGIAISQCPRDVKNPQLLAAQAADSLIGIRGIVASFVLCEQDNVIMISGRSLGEVNVQRILEKMGGGGHATIAGAQVKGAAMDDVKQTLKEKMKEYKKEIE